METTQGPWISPWATTWPREEAWMLKISPQASQGSYHRGSWCWMFEAAAEVLRHSWANWSWWRLLAQEGSRWFYCKVRVEKQLLCLSPLPLFGDVRVPPTLPAPLVLLKLYCRASSLYSSGVFLPLGGCKQHYYHISGLWLMLLGKIIKITWIYVG